MNYCITSFPLPIRSDYLCNEFFSILLIVKHIFALLCFCIVFNSVLSPQESPPWHSCCRNRECSQVRMVDTISQPGCAECGAGGLVLTDYRPYAFLRALLATSPAPSIRMFLPQLPPSNHLCEMFSATYGISLFSDSSVDETSARARGRCRFDGSLPDRNMERNFTRK